MRVVLFMGMSVNGLVARKNGDEDFLSHRCWKVFTKLVARYGCFVAGRRTQEQVAKWGKKYDFTKLPGLCVIVSKKGGRSTNKLIFAISPGDALCKLAKLGYREVLLAGGPTLNSSFAKAGYINEIILYVEPAIIGEGKALFYPRNFNMRLALRSVQRTSGYIILKYKVK